MSKTYLKWKETGLDTYVINNDYFSFVIIPSEKVGCWDLLIDDKVHNNQDGATLQSLDAAKAWADGYHVTWLSDTRSKRLIDGRTPPRRIVPRISCKGKTLTLLGRGGNEHP
jgi:hypothetical protein